MNRSASKGLAALGVTLAVLGIACGQTAPTPVATGEVWPPSNHWAPDLPQVTAAVVDEFHRAGLEVVPAERFAGEPFGAGMQRLAIPSLPRESIYLHVYRTAEQARSEASRIDRSGNLEPESGGPIVHVDYASTMHFYYRDRIIAKFGGCDDGVKALMATLFGPPIVVTSTPCWTLWGNR